MYPMFDPRDITNVRLGDVLLEVISNMPNCKLPVRRAMAVRADICPQLAKVLTLPRGTAGTHFKELHP